LEDIESNFKLIHYHAALMLAASLLAVHLFGSDRRRDRTRRGAKQSPPSCRCRGVGRVFWSTVLGMTAIVCTLLAVDSTLATEQRIEMGAQ
jgi:hypothetical protein